MADEKTLSKVSIGGVVYNLKDSYARTELAKLGTAALKDVASSISDGDGKIADAATVKAYVDSQVTSLNAFDVVVLATGEDLPAASATTMYKIYLKPEDDTVSGSYVEYIVIRSGSDGAYTYAWERIGTTTTDLTNYVPTSRTVAGLALSANITVAALQNALGLKAMAYAEAATGSVDGQTITGVKATGTTTGSITGELGFDSTAVASTGKFTPSGTVSGTTTASGNVTLASTTVATEGVQVSGTVGAPDISVTLAKADSVLGSVKDEAVAPTFSEGAFTAATLTHSEDTFAKAGIVAAIDKDDAELLVFSNASTGTASNITAFSGGSKAADTFNAGSAMTFNTKNVVSGVESATASAPAFTGGRIKASFAGTESDISASFSGTEGSLSVSGNYDKAKLGTVAFQGAAATFDVGDITVAAKTVTVSPKAD